MTISDADMEFFGAKARIIRSQSRKLDEVVDEASDEQFDLLIDDFASVKSTIEDSKTLLRREIKNNDDDESESDAEPEDEYANAYYYQQQNNDEHDDAPEEENNANAAEESEDEYQGEPLVNFRVKDA